MILGAVTLLSSSDGWSVVVTALLHSLWQAGLVGLLLFTALRLLPASRPAFRAALSGIGQLGVLLAFILTCVVLRSATSPSVVDRQPSDTKTSSVAPVAGGVAARPQPDATDAASIEPGKRPAPGRRELWNGDEWAGVVGIAWLVGVILMLVRTGADLAAGRRLVRTGHRVESRVADVVAMLCRRLKLRRRIDVVHVKRLGVPAVYGVLRPVLLLPAAVMQVPPEQFEAIVAHELAHIKRYDWLWHFAGRLVEAILFFNPAVWWIGRVAQREREAAADALAVAVTGAPVEFARALAGWAEHRSTAPAAALLWTGDSGSLRDRIVRVLTPSVRPPIRLSPVGAAVAILAAAVLLTGLWSGTRTVVAVAQELLSPAERIERVVTQRREVEQPEGSAGTGGEREQVTVSGTITRTTVGLPLAASGESGYGTVTIRSRVRRGPATSSGGYTGRVGPDGKFSATVAKGEITVTADWEGYAPATVGPLQPTRREALEHVELLLVPGFTGRIRLTAPDGAAVPQAAVEARLDAPARSQPRHFEADEEGIVHIGHAARHPYAVTVDAPGYQRETFRDVRLNPAESVTLTLSPTEPASGRVIDENGEPIAGAELRLFARSPKPGSLHTYTRTGPLLATTDGAGRFAITTLPADERTAVLVVAEGRGSEVRDVAAGASGLVVRLGPERILRGEVVGDLSKLDRRYVGGTEPVPSLRYSIRVALFDGTSDFDSYINQGDLAAVELIKTEPGEPARARFELRDLLPGEITISAGAAQRVIDPFEGLRAGVVIRLDEPTAGGPPRRKVVIRFVPPEPDAPPPAGDVRVDLKPLGEQADRHWKQFRASIEDGRVEVEAFAPGTVSIKNQGMVGYWFDEAVVGLVGNYRAFSVPAGDGPFEFTIPVAPAGAIRGRVAAADGSVPKDVREVDLQCYRVARPRHGPETISSQAVHPNAEGEFLITPVPLEGAYRVIADFGVTKIFSRAVSPAADEPIREVALQLPEFRSATVRVVDAEGRPVVDQRVSLRRRYDGWFTASRSPRTDDSGRVTFSQLAADAIDQYEVTIVDEGYRTLVEQPLLEAKGGETVLTLPSAAEEPR